LFDIYSSDLEMPLNDDNLILYADDTCLVYVGDDLGSLSNHVNSRLSIIYDWCNANKLSLNPVKSEYMIVTNRMNLSNLNLYIGQNLVKITKTFKYLGVQIDDHLKHGEHIKKVANKLYYLCGVSFRLKNFMNLQSAKNFYYSSVYSVINYCLAVWGGVGMCTSRCIRIGRLQHRILKNLFRKYFPERSCLFKAVGILKFIDMYKFKVSVFMYGVLKNNLFPTLQEGLELNLPSHTHNTRSAGNFISPFPRVEIVRMNYRHQFIKVWNELPETLTNLESLSSFKKQLKSYFVSLY